MGAAPGSTLPCQPPLALPLEGSQDWENIWTTHHQGLHLVVYLFLMSVRTVMLAMLKEHAEEKGNNHLQDLSPRIVVYVLLSECADQSQQ